MLSGTAILLLGLTLGIAALVAIRGSGGRLSGRGFAWVGILQLPVVWFLLFVWLMQGSTASPELTAEPTGVEQMNPDAARVKTRDDIFWGQPMFGLQAGLAVKQAKFEAGKPMEFLVHFRNDGENRITTIPPCPETLVFIRGKDADHPISPRSRERNSRLPFDLKAGQEKAFPVSVGGPGWLFDGKPADQLAAGTYSVHLNHLWPGPGKNWLLCVSGPVEIEIVEPEGRGP